MASSRECSHPWPSGISRNAKYEGHRSPNILLIVQIPGDLPIDFDNLWRPPIIQKPRSDKCRARAADTLDS
jgi:hypothetical protein